MYNLLSPLILLGECCYIYGSVPRNDSICVPDEDQLALMYTIYNPHDNFTNLTVTWFRSAREDLSNYEMLFDEYRQPATTPTQDQVGNCSQDLYRDTFILEINRFSRNETGYYWCQLAINNSYAQQSRPTLFYADSNSSTFCGPPYFRLALQNEIQCAQHNKTKKRSSNILAIASTTTSQSSGASSVKLSAVTRSSLSTVSFNTPSTIMETKVSNQGPITYVAGILSALILIFGILVILLSILYLCKFQKKNKSKSQ